MNYGAVAPWFVPVPEGDGEIDLSHGRREEPPAWSVASLIGLGHPLAWEVDLLGISMQIIAVALAMSMPWTELELGSACKALQSYISKILQALFLTLNPLNDFRGAHHTNENGLWIEDITDCDRLWAYRCTMQWNHIAKDATNYKTCDTYDIL